MANKKGFTLIEVLVSIILAGIIVYFLYIMMLTSFQSYKTLFGISQGTSDIRVCETYLKRSIHNASYIKIDNVSGPKATRLNFGRQELYWDSTTSTIKNRFVLDSYYLRVTIPILGVAPGFYLDDVNEGNNIPNPRESAKAYQVPLDLMLQIYYTGYDFNTTGYSVIREEQVLTGVRVGYYFIPSNTAGGVKRFTFVKIGLDFDEVLATGEVFRNIRLFHFIARGFGLPS